MIKKYKQAWEQQDSNKILECFATNGIYQESPLAKPYIGHSEIKNFWDNDVKKTAKDIKFTLGNCFISKDTKTGFAEWKCKKLQYFASDKKWKRTHMVGIMVLKMQDSKITYLNEYWNTKTSK